MSLAWLEPEALLGSWGEGGDLQDSAKVASELCLAEGLRRAGRGRARPREGAGASVR